MNKKVSFADFLPAIFTFICAIGLMTFARGCDIKDDGSWMRCHSAQLTAFAISLALTVFLIFPAILKSKLAKIIFFILGITGGVLLFLVPGIIKPMCRMQTMRCYTIMQPFVRLFSLLEIISSLLLCLKAAFKKEK